MAQHDFPHPGSIDQDKDALIDSAVQEMAEMLHFATDPNIDLPRSFTFGRTSPSNNIP